MITIEWKDDAYRRLIVGLLRMHCEREGIHAGGVCDCIFNVTDDARDAS